MRFKTINFFLLSFSVFILPAFLFSQSPYPKKYWIQFKDKNNNPFTISNPADYLSSRAINRRSKQSIVIRENDLPITPAYIDSIISTGVKILNKSKWFNAVTVLINDSLQMNQILSLTFVKDYQAVSIIKKKLPDDYVVSGVSIDKTGIISDFEYGQSYNQISMLKGDSLHSRGYDGKNILIAVLDAGFYRVDSIAVFDSLRKNNQIILTYDFVEGNNSVYEDHTHGMNVLSVMGANSSGEIIGTAPKADYLLLRSENANSELLIEEDNWAAAIEFADSMGADVVNSSLGYSTFDDTSMNHTYADMDGNTIRVTIAADIAASKGILVVNSAGNEGSVQWKYIIAPADGDSVLAVGAADFQGNYVNFSSLGPSSDGRIKPNVAAQGLNTTITDASGNITTGSGTSFAAPVIAGLASCLWQANPDKTNMDIIKAIEKSASQYYNPDEKLGYGIPNFKIADDILKGKIINPYESDFLIGLYPVPVYNDLVIAFYSRNSSKLGVSIYDVLGRQLYVDEFNLETNAENKIIIERVKSFDIGVYFIYISSNQISILKKIIKS